MANRNPICQRPSFLDSDSKNGVIKAANVGAGRAPNCFRRLKKAGRVGGKLQEKEEAGTQRRRLLSYVAVGNHLDQHHQPWHKSLYEMQTRQQSTFTQHRRQQHPHRQKNTITTLESSLLYPEEAFRIAGHEGRSGGFVLFAPSGRRHRHLACCWLGFFFMMTAIRMVSIINKVFGGGRLSCVGNRKKLVAGRGGSHI